MFNFLKKKVYYGGEMVKNKTKQNKKNRKESGKFIKTILCVQGTGITFVEPFHSPGNTHNVVLRVVFLVFSPSFLFFFFFLWSMRITS